MHAKIFNAPHRDQTTDCLYNSSHICTQMCTTANLLNIVRFFSKQQHTHRQENLIQWVVCSLPQRLIKQTNEIQEKVGRHRNKKKRKISCHNSGKTFIRQECDQFNGGCDTLLFQK